MHDFRCERLHCLMNNCINMKKNNKEKDKATEETPKKEFKLMDSEFGYKMRTTVKSETFRFVLGLMSVIFAVYMLLSFSSFFFTGGSDQSILSHPVPGELVSSDTHIENYTGAQGAQLANFLMNRCFGIPAYFLVIFFIALGMHLMQAYKIRLRKWFFGCFVGMYWCSIALGFFLGTSFENSFIYPGGMHGYRLSEWLEAQIGAPGVCLLLLTTAILIGLTVTRNTMDVVRKAVHPTFPNKWKKSKNMVDDESDAQPESSENVDLTDDSSDDSQTVSGKSPVDENVAEEVAPSEDILSPITDWSDKLEDTADEDNVSSIELLTQDSSDKDLISTPDIIENENPEIQSKEVIASQLGIEQPIPVPESANQPSFEISQSNSEEDEAVRGDLNHPYNPRLDLEHYKFPTLDLLKDYSSEHEPNIDMDEQNANKDRIIQVLRSFGIEISSIKASVGPTITLYEITPAEGVRISKIRNLEDDIALSLSALGIRIIAPIPGKGTIGIEVPNANPKIVPMSSVLASKKFQDTTFDLPIALGRTITNEVFMVDLAKAPHMLVAGATGQGKSVGLNAIVTSLLYKKHPSELKFVIIDPKKVEFAIYAPIEKHFLAKLPDGDDAIITDVTKVVQTLNSLCVEMDTRYELLREARCRHIKEYNAKFINRELNPAKGHRFLPYIVIIIDEFGDLIMTAGKDVELPICRIAQLARAVGIHAIIATQRPTTNIITGTIKANFPARVAFRVASMMDSRTILDRPGAQQLIGKGDMLYLQGSDPVRVQCAFVDTPEVERIAQYISKQQGYPSAFMLPEYVDPNAETSDVSSVDMNRLDPLFEEAANLLIYHQQGSTSLIQRKFSIGYNRAGRIMDQLERAGIVGPSNGSKPREVLCLDVNDLEMRMSNFREQI